MMRYEKLLTTGVLSGILVAAFAVAIHAEEKKCGKSAEAGKACVNYCKETCRTATVEVTNTENGVVIKMTATNPDDVKKIQECWANREACRAARGDSSEKAATTCRSAGKSAPKVAEQPKESATKNWAPEEVKQPKAHSGHDHSGHKH